MRYFLQISYNGSGYSGWQVQDNAIGIQQIFNEKISLQLGSQVYCIGCGRTDKGVHARKFFLHFDYEGKLPQKFIPKLNSFLPKDLAVHKLFMSSLPEAHSRWSATERTYKYLASIGKTPLLLGYAGTLYQQPDLQAMREAADTLLRHSDFVALSKRSYDSEHYLVNIKSVSLKQKNNMVIFTITANRFLRGMVRIVAGTLFEVGKGRISPEDFENIIISRDRRRAFGAADAEGLYLWDVKYPDGMLTEASISDIDDITG